MAFLGSFHLWNPLKGQYRWTGLSNWQTALGSSLFWRAMGNTVWFSVVAVVARVLIGLLLASALHAKMVKWKSLFRTLYYLPTITPMVAVAFVWKFMYQPQFGLINQLLGTKINWLFDARYAMSAILLLTIWKDFGYAVVILLGGLYSLPTDCMALAASGKRVVLLDFDTRKQRVHQALNIPRGSVQDFVQALGQEDTVTGLSQCMVEASPGFVVIPFVSIPEKDESELFASPAFEALVNVLGQYFDFVVFDSM